MSYKTFKIIQVIFIALTAISVFDFGYVWTVDPLGFEDNDLNATIDESTGDPDSDNLSNLEEYQYETNPQCNDTDSDLMLDGWEISMGFNAIHDDSGEDLDLDLLKNLQEYQCGTYANDNDSDDDIFTDTEEIIAETDPMNSFDYPVYPVETTTEITTISITISVYATTVETTTLFITVPANRTTTEITTKTTTTTTSEPTETTSSTTLETTTRIAIFGFSGSLILMTILAGITILQRKRKS